MLVGELTEFLTTEGDSFLTELQDGIFESVDINEEAESDKGIFYIYDRDPSYWEITQKA